MNNHLLITVQGQSTSNINDKPINSILYYGGKEVAIILAISILILSIAQLIKASNN